MFRIFVLILCFGITGSSSAQIRLANPSFEGDPQDATTPTGWMPCMVGSTPDILPGAWGVYTPASDGETFLGMITREDGSWENIGQRLKQPLKALECYSFQIDLARSSTYSDYNMPLKLRIWAGETLCSLDQLLGETGFIKHTDWQTYTFNFLTKKKYNYIILEAHYATGVLFSYKGNILLDACSTINPCIRADKL